MPTDLIQGAIIFFAATFYSVIVWFVGGGLAWSAIGFVIVALLMSFVFGLCEMASEEEKKQI